MKKVILAALFVFVVLVTGFFSLSKIYTLEIHEPCERTIEEREKSAPNAYNVKVLDMSRMGGTGACLYRFVVESTLMGENADNKTLRFIEISSKGSRYIESVEKARMAECMRPESRAILYSDEAVNGVNKNYDCRSASIHQMSVGKQ